MATKYYISDGNYDDLYQEGMIGVFEAVQNYDFSRGDENSDSFKSFVLMCAKRQILDAIKHSQRKKNSPLNNYVALDQGFDGNLEFNMHSRISDPEDLVIQEETIKEKNETIELLLSNSEKEVLNLYLDGKRQSEIAQILGKPVKSVDNTLQRVKNKLKGKK